MRDYEIQRKYLLLIDPHPNPLGKTTSHSTRLQNTAAKSLVIPLAGEGTATNVVLRCCSSSVPIHRKIMAGSTRQHEPVPDEVPVTQARIIDKENGACRVSQAAGDQPGKPGCGQARVHRINRDHDKPSHEQV